MKNNAKNTPHQLGLWNSKQKLDKAQQQKIKGGTDPWANRKDP